MLLMREKLEALTSLRFIAAILVVVYHTLPPEMLDAWPALTNIRGSGFTGVSLFFCLSGFILFIVYEHLSRHRGEILQFLVARVARIYPLYVFSLMLDLPRLVAVRIDGYGLELGIAATGVTLAGNLLMLQVWVPQLGGLNYPSWSVATEAAFYVAFPFVIVFVRRIQTTRAVLACLCATFAIAIVVTSISAGLAGSGTAQVLLSRNPIAKFPEFLAGMLLGAFWLRRRVHEDRISFLPDAVALSGLMVWVGVMAAGPEAVGGEKMMNTILMPIFWLLIFGLASRTAKVSRALAAQPFVFLGEISYAIYLLHAPLQYLFFKNMALKIDLPIYLIYLAALFCTSAAAYMVIEVPLRRRINRLPQRYYLRSGPRM